jgi:hypothetical protein
MPQLEIPYIATTQELNVKHTDGEGGCASHPQALGPLFLTC